MKASVAVAPSAPATSRFRGTRGWRDRVPDLLASYLAFVAAFSGLIAVFPVLRHALAWPRIAVEYVSITVTPNLAYAIVLALLAGACRRRLRAAWWLVFLLLAVPAALDPLVQATSGRLSYVPAALVAGAVVVALFLARPAFTARIERGNSWKALGALVLLLSVGVLIGWS